MWVYMSNDRSICRTEDSIQTTKLLSVSDVMCGNLLSILYTTLSINQYIFKFNTVFVNIQANKFINHWSFVKLYYQMVNLVKKISQQFHVHCWKYIIKQQHCELIDLELLIPPWCNDAVKTDIRSPHVFTNTSRTLFLISVSNNRVVLNSSDHWRGWLL